MSDKMLVNTFEKKGPAASHAMAWIMNRLDYNKIAKAVTYSNENPDKETKVVLFEYLQPNAEYIRKNGNSATVHFLPDGTTVDSALRSNYEVRDFMDNMFLTHNTRWYIRFNHQDGGLEASSRQVVLHFLEKLPPLAPWPYYSTVSHDNSSHCYA